MNEPSKPLVAVIMSGGTGARLWPVSREALPKPFIKLHDGHSLLQGTAQRILSLPSCRQIITVTNRDYYFLTRDEYSEICPTGSIFDYLLEPVGRNTAPAIAAASMLVNERFGREAIMLVLPADHIVSNQAAFNQAVNSAASLAAAGWLVTFGAPPKRAETGYGYIKCGSAIGDSNGFTVDRFIEKPPPQEATRFVRSSGYLWNSGMFCFAAGSMLDAIRAHCPEVLQCVSAAFDSSRNNIRPIVLEPTAFAKCPDISIDYAVMERSDRVAVVPGNFGWEDVGSWNAILEQMPCDAYGNRANGEVLFLDSQNCYVQAESKIVAAIGVSNLIVVDTPDALLITDRDRSQEVKNIVDRLRLCSHDTVRHHRTVHRPWGTYTVLEEGAGFKIKKIVVKPGASLSLQRHRFRSEHWVVVSGEARVTNEDRCTRIGKNESTFIAAGTAHRLQNPGNEDCVMIEVQVGSYVGEDDIERLDDVYGRVNPPR